MAHGRCGNVAAKYRSRQHRRCCGLWPTALRAVSLDAIESARGAWIRAVLRTRTLAKGEWRMRLRGMRYGAPGAVRPRASAVAAVGRPASRPIRERGFATALTAFAPGTACAPGGDIHNRERKRPAARRRELGANRARDARRDEPKAGGHGTPPTPEARRTPTTTFPTRVCRADRNSPSSKRPG